MPRRFGNVTALARKRIAQIFSRQRTRAYVLRNWTKSAGDGVKNGGRFYKASWNQTNEILE
jgi:hypothetical protein